MTNMNDQILRELRGASRRCRDARRSRSGIDLDTVPSRRPRDRGGRSARGSTPRLARRARCACRISASAPPPARRGRRRSGRSGTPSSRPSRGWPPTPCAASWTMPPPARRAGARSGSRASTARWRASRRSRGGAMGTANRRSSARGRRGRRAAGADFAPAGPRRWRPRGWTRGSARSGRCTHPPAGTLRRRCGRGRADAGGRPGGHARAGRSRPARLSCCFRMSPPRTRRRR